MPGLLGGGSEFTCRYHPTTSLFKLDQPLAVDAPPPWGVVHNVAVPGSAFPISQVSPTFIAVVMWYCPICTYTELHYVPAGSEAADSMAAG